MAFQPHSIPWHNVSSGLAYTAARSAPGPQYARIAFKRPFNQIPQLEHFATKFRTVVNEHVLIERSRYRSTEAYAARAKTWTASDSDHSTSDSSSEPRAAAQASVLSDEQRTIRNQELRKLKTALDQGGYWPVNVENRYVYPSDFIDIYHDASYWSEKQRRNVDFLCNNVGRTIQDWINLSSFLSTGIPKIDDRRDALSGIYRIVYNHGDVLKLLVTDAAMTAQADRRRFTVETLFLLANHPQIKLEQYTNLYITCCNLGCGLNKLAEYALKVFVFLNVIASMQDAGVADITRKRDSAFIFDIQTSAELDFKTYRGKGRWPPSYGDLAPRPNYMNTTSWTSLIAEVCNSHENLAETWFFCQIFFPPRPEDGTAEEIDLLSDRKLLREQLKRIWRIILLVDMITRELGREMDWEYMALAALNELFGWPFDESWVEYECSCVVRSRDQDL